MHRKLDTVELDIPRDDIECWERYPKHHWVYDLSRVLDAQNIGWSPYESASYPHRELNMCLTTADAIVQQPGFIYIKPPTEDKLITEVYIVKGEVKLMRHLSPKTGEELVGLIGEIELRLSAFVTLYFAKFTGVISCETIGHDIFRIQLRPHSDLSLTTNTEIVKLTKRIYKRSDLQLSGLTDRALHETLAS